MSYQKYKIPLTCLSPVAVRVGQHGVHAPNRTDWGIVTCNTCGEKFWIGPHRIYGSRLTEQQCASEVERMLARDHGAGQPHADHHDVSD